MKKYLTPFVLLALLAALMTGCTNASRIIATGLSVEVTGIERATDGSVTATWHVNNANIGPYLLSRVSHKIYLGRTYIGSVLDVEPLAIPPNNKAGRTSKLSGGDAAAVQAITEAATKGSAEYRVETQITILIYDETVEKSVLANLGTLTVISK